jgi:hypothetical protein
MQTLIVILIVAAAIFFAGRRMYQKLSKPAQSDCDCGCGCEGCSASDNCSEKSSE